jgi:hypothetical protein
VGYGLDKFVRRLGQQKKESGNWIDTVKLELEWLGMRDIHVNSSNDRNIRIIINKIYIITERKNMEIAMTQGDVH